MKKSLEQMTKTVESLPVDDCVKNEQYLRYLISACEKKRDEMFQRKKQIKDDELSALKKEIKYCGAQESTRTYDDKAEDEHEMSEAVNGSCEFSSQEQSELFKKLINSSDNAYYYNHKVHWSGVGKYIITPKTEQDHDCEYVFEYHYTKAE